MKKNGQIFNCVVCGAGYYVPLYRFAITSTCSVECSWQARFKRITELSNAVAKTYLAGSSIRQTAENHLINNRTVAKLLNHSNTKIRGRSESIKTSWEHGRREGEQVRLTHRLVRSRKTCELCNGAAIQLEIHHRDGKGSDQQYDKRNEGITNLQLLCRTCHMEVERANGRGPYARKTTRWGRPDRPGDLENQ
jgi:hypothetical protein